MSLFDDLVANETVASVRAKLVALAQSAGLAVTNWFVGGVGQQMLETMTQSGFATANIFAAAIRGYASLDTSVDPGDPDPFDATNVSKAQAPGLLSNKGKNDFGTTRVDKTFASGFATFVNAGTVPRTFGPSGLVFTWTANTPPSPAPTYHNTPDPSIYTNPDGTVTVAAGAPALVIPVEADQAGMFASAPAGSLTLTTGFVGCSATNDAAIVGLDREPAPTYRARCRQADSRLSLGGPQDAYRYFARTNLDGTPLLNGSGNPVATNRVYTNQDSATGVVGAYFASPSGPASAEDVTAANTNITTQVLSVPGAVTYSGQAAIATSIHVVGTAKIKAAPGITAPIVKQAIVKALAAAFSAFDVGGVDQVAGAGVIYTADIQAIAAAAYPGLYDVLVTTPGGTSTAIALGHVATLNSVVGDWTVALT